jgi:hypothetical protein
VPLGEADDGLAGARPVDAAPDQQEGTLGPPEQVGSLADGLRVRRQRVGHPVGPGFHGARRHRLVVEDVAGNLDEHGPPAATHRRPQGRLEQLGDALGPRDLDGELGHRPEHPQQVEFLEGILLVVLEGDPAHEDDDRRVSHVRGGDPGEQVRRPRTAGDEAHAGRVRHPPQPVRHEGGGLLVAHVDVLDGRVVVERVEHVEEGRADDAEDVPDLLGLQEVDDRASGGDVTHGRVSSVPSSRRRGRTAVAR